MTRTTSLLTSLALASSLLLTSCESPEGTGALAGAGFGAIMGGLTGNGKGKNIAAGAAIGAASGALLGNLLGRPREGDYYEGRHLPYGRYVRNGLVESPYRPYNLIDTRGIPRGAVVEDPSTGGRFIKP